MKLLSVDDARGRMLAEIAARRPRPCRWRRRSAGCWPRMSPPCATSRRSRPRPWTAGRCASADCPGRLKIVGESAAGHGFEGAVGAGEAVRIFTGAAVPDGLRRHRDPGGRRAATATSSACPAVDAGPFRPAGGRRLQGRRGAAGARRADRSLAAVAGGVGGAGGGRGPRPAARGAAVHRRGDRRGAGRRPGRSRSTTAASRRWRR